MNTSYNDLLDQLCDGIEDMDADEASAYALGAQHALEHVNFPNANDIATMAIGHWFRTKQDEITPKLTSGGVLTDERVLNI